LFLGESGSGKSHLIDVLFGKKVKVIDGFKWGTQELEIIHGAFSYKSVDYQVKFVDTKGVFDPLNGVKNVETTLKELNTKFPKINYVFVCVKYDRYKINTREALEHIMSTIGFPEERIKVFITNCDGWSDQALLDIKLKFDDSEISELIRNYDVSFVGSFNEALVIPQLIAINKDLKDKTRKIVGEIISKDENLNDGDTSIIIKPGCTFL